MRSAATRRFRFIAWLKLGGARPKRKWYRSDASVSHKLLHQSTSAKRRFLMAFSRTAALGPDPCYQRSDPGTRPEWAGARSSFATDARDEAGAKLQPYPAPAAGGCCNTAFQVVCERELVSLRPCSATFPLPSVYCCRYLLPIAACNWLRVLTSCCVMA